MLGSAEAIAKQYVLPTGLREVLERLGLKLGSSDFVRYRSGLGLGFWRMFASLLMTNANLDKVTYVIQLRYFLQSFHTFSYDDLACSSCCFEY